MKIQFESQLEYQNHAINSIVNIFEGQEICQSNFTVTGINDNLLTYHNHHQSYKQSVQIFLYHNLNHQ